MKSALLLIGLISLNCFGAAGTFYVDFTGGADANNGTSTGTAWKRHPKMANAASTSLAHTVVAGDVFVFKGGEIWTNSFPLSWTESGTTANPIYATVSNAWYTGGSWTRPCFDGMSNNNDHITFGIGISNVVVDSIEMRNHTKSDGIYVTCINNSTFTNLYIHKWWRGDDTVDGIAGGIYNNYAGGGAMTIQNFLVTNCKFDNSDGCGDYGVCIRGAGELAYCFLSYAPELQLHGGYSIHDCEFTTNTQSYLGDAAQHPNVTYLDNFNGQINLPAGTNIFFFNNYIHDIRDAGVQLIYPNMGTGNFTSQSGNFYCYNNVIINAPNSRTVNIDQYGATAGANYNYFIWNNTLENTKAGTIIGVVDRTPSVPAPKTNSFYNNHFIGIASIYDSSGSSNSLSGLNVTNTVAAANAAGYVAATFYAPVNGSGATIAAGTNFTSTALASITNDTTLGFTRAVNARPAATAWDIGAFQFIQSGTTVTTSAGGKMSAAGALSIH